MSHARVSGVAVADDVAIIGGPAAWFLAHVLSERVPGGIDRVLADMRVMPEARKALTEAYDALEEVGARWQTKHAASPQGNGEGQTAGARLASEAWITTREASLLLGRTPRRVRQFAEDGKLTSRLRSARREFPRAEVLELRELLALRVEAA